MAFFKLGWIPVIKQALKNYFVVKNNAAIPALVAQKLSQSTIGYNLNAQVPLLVRSNPITNTSIYSNTWAWDGSLDDGQGVVGYTPVGWFNFINGSYSSTASIPCVNFGVSIGVNPLTEYTYGGCRLAWMGSNFSGSNGQAKAELYIPGGNGARIRLNAGTGSSYYGNVVIGEEVSLNNTGNSAEDTTFTLRVAGSGSFTSQSSSTPVLQLTANSGQSANILQVNTNYGLQLASIDYQGSLHLQGAVKVHTLPITNSSSPNSYLSLDPSFGNVLTTGNYVLSLPNATLNLGMEITIIKRDSASTTQTINCSTTGQTINGQSSLVITAQYNSVTLLSDGTNWYIK